MSEITNNNLSNKDERSLIGVILLFIKLGVLIGLTYAPFILIEIILKKYKFYAACMFVDIAGLIFACFFILYIYCKKENLKLRLKQKISIPVLFYMILLQIGYRLLYDSTLLGFLRNNFKTSDMLKMDMNLYLATPILQFISICLVAPIVEELLLRGILLEHLRTKCSDLTAVLISSLLFAIIHGNLHQGVGAFFSGLFLGLVYIKTKSLLSSIFLHIVNNSLVMLSTYIFIDIYQMRPIVIIISLALISISLLLINKIKVDENKKFNFRFLEKHELVQ